MSRKYKATMVRVPDDLRDYLKQQAEQNRRSLASEMLFRLERSCKQDDAREREEEAA